MRWRPRSMLPLLEWNEPEGGCGLWAGCRSGQVVFVRAVRQSFIVLRAMEKPMTDQLEVVTEVQTPCGLNHLVLNVRDLEESHRFWTEFLRFRQVGTGRRPNRGGKPRPRMYFYSGEQDGKLRHHDIALVEQRMLPADPAEGPRALNHVAIA